MSSRLDTERLIRDIVRLRRAELRGAPEDVADVREDLEEIVGPTVGRASSARVLGITQTALDRHISRGSVPVVLTPSGRKEIPLPELVRLVLDLDRTRETTDSSRPLGAALRSRREAAKQLKASTVVPPNQGAGLDPGNLRALAFHRAVAARLDPQMVSDARRRLRRWSRNGSVDEHWRREWESVLSLPLREIRQLISAENPRARDLRQSSPFAGALPHEDRQRVLEFVDLAA